MKEELDKKLCEKYPKIFAGRNGDVHETAMCWGFEHGDGWYDLIDVLCANIQHHIDRRAEERELAVRFNVMKMDIENDNWGLFDQTYNNPQGAHRESYIKRIREAKEQEIKDLVPQVVAVQVKEKFGSLRFYYDGGDEYIRALVNFAESMSGRICEKCGSPGKTRGGGWVRTLCDEHEEEYQNQHREFE